MNKLEELHLQVIQDCTVENYYPEYSSDISESLLITKSAEITEQIAIEFLEFVENNYYYNSSCWVNCETDEVKLRKDIFEEFLKQRQ